jgi:hypothetical protein
MKTTLLTLAIMMVAAVVAVTAGSAGAQQARTAAGVMQGNTSVPFTKNMGQWPVLCGLFGVDPFAEDHTSTRATFD